MLALHFVICIHILRRGSSHCYYYYLPAVHAPYMQIYQYVSATTCSSTSYACTIAKYNIRILEMHLESAAACEYETKSAPLLNPARPEASQPAENPMFGGGGGGGGVPPLQKYPIIKIFLFSIDVKDRYNLHKNASRPAGVPLNLSLHVHTRTNVLLGTITYSLPMLSLVMPSSNKIEQIKRASKKSPPQKKKKNPPPSHHVYSRPNTTPKSSQPSPHATNGVTD